MQQAKAIFQVAPLQLVSFFGYGFEPAKAFNPYQAWELYLSTDEGKKGDRVWFLNPTMDGTLNGDEVATGFMDYLVTNDYGRYVEPEEVADSDIPPVMFFQWFFIPRGNDLRDLFLHLGNHPEIHLTQHQAEQVAVAYMSAYFIDGKVTRDLYFKGFLPQKATNQKDIERIINTVNNDRMKKEVTESIATRGYALHAVSAGEGDPQFIYSDGLVNKVGYELIGIAAIPVEMLHTVVEELVQQSLQSPLELGEVKTSLVFQNDLPVRVKLIEATAENLYDKFVCRVQAEKPRTLQVLIADMDNILPDEPGFNKDFVQPLLVK